MQRLPIVLTLLALSTAALAACAAVDGILGPRDAEVAALEAEAAALESAVNGLPDVTAAEFTLSRYGPWLFAQVDLAADINPDSAAMTVREIVDLLGAKAFDEVRGTLTVTVGMGHARLATWPVELEINFPNPPASGTLVEETRLWRELSTGFPSTQVRIDTDESGNVRGRVVGVNARPFGSSEAVVDALLELERLPWPRTPGRSAWHVASDGLSLEANSAFPPSRGVEAIRALVGVGGLVASGDQAWVTARWDADSGCLGVGLDVSLAEFRNVPNDELDAARVRDRATPLTDEYLRRLRGSGVPYSFHAVVSGEESGSGPGSLKLFDVHRCGTGRG